MVGDHPRQVTPDFAGYISSDGPPGRQWIGQ
jgi:hypothetical protein